jgi:hypothetical protein
MAAFLDEMATGKHVHDMSEMHDGHHAPDAH